MWAHLLEKFVPLSKGVLYLKNWIRLMSSSVQCGWYGYYSWQSILRLFFCVYPAEYMNINAVSSNSYWLERGVECHVFAIAVFIRLSHLMWIFVPQESCEMAGGGALCFLVAVCVMRFIRIWRFWSLRVTSSYLFLRICVRIIDCGVIWSFVNKPTFLMSR